MVAAVMGAKAKSGHASHGDNKAAAERKKKASITAGSFDRQVAGKMGPYFAETFLPQIRELAEAGLSYDQVKRLVKIPTTWGAKITGEQFRERAVVPKAKK
jgi:hypothetical protein